MAKKVKNVRRLTADQLLQEIVEVLAGTDGETIAEIANSVFADRPFTYIGDSVFEQKVKE